MIESVVQEVLQDVPEAPLMTIREAIGWAARELCTEADVWVVHGEPVVAAADTPYAEIDAPATAEPLRIILLSEGGRPLTPGRHYVQAGPNRVEFRHMPSQSLLYGELACRPKPGEQMPGELTARWARALANGAKYRLLALPQPWRDLNLAEVYRRLFVGDQTEAKSLAKRGHQAGSQRVQPRPFL